MSRDVTVRVLVERNDQLRHKLDMLARENKLLRELYAAHSRPGYRPLPILDYKAGFVRGK